MEREEAVKIIRKNYPHVGSSGTEFETALRELIPELNESRDERIRKSLLAYIKGESKRLDTKNWIAYLERQKERKPLSTEETELNSIAFLEQMGYTCIPPGAKPAEWSEEDEVIIREITEFLQDNATEELFYAAEDWLKSLRPSWKPNDEQMKALKETAEWKRYSNPQLFSLYTDLQKLL